MPKNRNINTHNFYLHPYEQYERTQERIKEMKKKRLAREMEVGVIAK